MLQRLFRRRSLTNNEKLATVIFGGLSLLGLLGMLFGVLIPTGHNGQIEPQTAGLCLGPFAGGLGAIALIAMRRRVGQFSGALIGAIFMWFAGMTLLGFGIFNAFNPGDNTILENFRYSVALCFAPGLISSLLAIGAYWYSELRERGTDVAPAEAERRPEATESQGPAETGYEEIERRATDYKRRIILAVRERKNGPLKDALRPVLDKIDAWEARVRQLTRWLAAFDADTATQRDLRETPPAMATLQAEMARESDPNVRAQMNETLAGYQAQQARLDELQSAARQTRLQLDEALSAMGLIYSQLQLLAVKELDNASARRISEGIQEQTDRLDDLLSSVTEVYEIGDGQAQDTSAGSMDSGRARRSRLGAADG